MRLPVSDGAFCVGSTRVIADVLALASDTNTLVWTIPVSIGTASLGETASSEWVANIASGTDASVAGQAGLTDGRLVAGTS